MGSLLHSFVFSAWDNVVGPKVVKTWPASLFSKYELVSNDSVIDEVGTEVDEISNVKSDIVSSNAPEQPASNVESDPIAKYISIHTLTGHLVRSKHTDYDSVNQIFLEVPSLGFTSQTATFYCLSFHSSTDKGNPSVVEEPYMVSLSTVLHYSNFNKSIWKFQPLLIHLLEKVVECLKVGMSQDMSYFEQPIVDDWLGAIYQTLVETSRLTIKNPPDPLVFKQIIKKSQIEWDVLITAMLTTLGSCCIVGKNEDHINHLVDILSFFLPDTHKAACSRYACDRFTGGLFIQGVLENSIGIRNINSADVLLNDYPLTLLDLTKRGQIKFTGHVHEHHRNKMRHLREQELNIINRRNPDISFTTESVFRPFRDSSRYVRWCLEQLATHNAEQWSRIISAFHQALALQAHDVIKAFSAKDFQSSDRLKLRRAFVKKTMKISEVDFWLLVATGERLKPGFSRLFANYKL